MPVKKARKITVILLISLSVALLLGSTMGLFFLTHDAKLDESKLPHRESEVILLDSFGDRIQDPNYVISEEISPYIKDAFLASEDKRFYHHPGVDPIRLVGATLKNLKYGKAVEGGSTITCQLVKNTHLTNEKTIKRKIQESKIAFEIERKYSKDQILEMYLNVIYFGKGIYGVKEACQRIYNKDPLSVSPREAASLAATIANPAKYSLLINPDENRKRTDLILSLMLRQNRLTPTLYQTAIDSEIIINYGKNKNNYSEIYRNLALFEYRNLKIKTSNAPLVVHTYYSKIAQEFAEKAIEESPAGEILNGNLAVKELILAENSSSGVIAYASNRPFGTSSKRQPGSLLKPFIYARAIENGIILPESPCLDAPTDHQGYNPTNYGNTYAGWISAKEALSRSVNTVSVNILQKEGVTEGFQTITQCGIPLSDKDKNLALALGGTTFGSTLPEICEGYLTLANNGTNRKLAFIKKIEKPNGKILYQRGTNSSKVLGEESCYLVTDMLRECAKSGTAKQLSYLDCDLAAKTGTVAKGSGNSDAWCAGYTTEHTFICRYSSESGSNLLLSSVTGGNQPTKTVRALLRSLYEQKAPEAFTPPITLFKRQVDKTLKEELHKLVLYKDHEFGESEYIFATANFAFESVDPESLFLANLQIKRCSHGTTISFDKAKGISYRILLNGKECKENKDGYSIKKQRFPIAKLEIYCVKDEKILYKKSAIVRIV